MNKNLKLVLCAFVLLTVLGCSKDDDATSNDRHSNGILKLTESPIAITQSTFIIDGEAEQIASTISFAEIDEINILS